MNRAVHRRLSAAWLVPLAIMIVVIWILVDAYRGRGIAVSVDFPDGHGLGPGDPVRCRGIEVGAVESVRLMDSGVEVVLRIDPLNAHRLARAGSRWWISRPQLDWSRVSGLDSLVGPRFVQVDPGVPDASPRTVFTGLAEAPILEQIEPGDLTIVLVAEVRGSLQPGAALNYRGVRIGTILSTALASDSTGVVAQVLVRRRYVPLVRSNSRFAQSGAFDLDIGLTGLRARLDSLETLVIGGVSMATPTEAGARVESGHRFAVAVEPDDEWFEWRPAIDTTMDGRSSDSESGVVSGNGTR